MLFCFEAGHPYFLFFFSHDVDDPRCRARGVEASGCPNPRDLTNPRARAGEKIYWPVYPQVQSRFCVCVCVFSEMQGVAMNVRRFPFLSRATGPVNHSVGLSVGWLMVSWLVGQSVLILNLFAF